MNNADHPQLVGKETPIFKSVSVLGMRCNRIDMYPFSSIHFIGGIFSQGHK